MGIPSKLTTIFMFSFATLGLKACNTWHSEYLERCDITYECLRPAYLVHRDFRDEDRLDQGRVKEELARVAKGLPRFADYPWLVPSWKK